MTEDKLLKLINFCKCSVYVEVNDHKSFYESVENYLEERHLECLNETDKDVLDKIYETDNLVYIQFYPNTPIGFYSILHYDLDKALDLALEIINCNK
jgi:hypothetical protein